MLLFQLHSCASNLGWILVRAGAQVELLWNKHRNMCHVSHKFQANICLSLKYSSPSSDQFNSELAAIKMLGNFLLLMLNSVFLNILI